MFKKESLLYIYPIHKYIKSARSSLVLCYSPTVFFSKIGISLFNLKNLIDIKQGFIVIFFNAFWQSKS